MLIKLHCASREAIWLGVKILLKGGPSFIRAELRKCLKPQVTEDLVSWIIFTGDSVKPQVWVKLHYYYWCIMTWVCFQGNPVDHESLPRMCHKFMLVLMTIGQGYILELV